jgi:hypothetical protein
VVGFALGIIVIPLFNFASAARRAACVRKKQIRIGAQHKKPRIIASLRARICASNAPINY